MFPEADILRSSHIILIGFWNISNIDSLCRQCRADFQICICQLPVRDRLQAFHILHIKMQFFQQCLHDFSAILFCISPHRNFVDHTTHYQCFLKQPVRCRDLHQIDDFHTTARLSEDRYIFRISAKCSDVVMHPLKCRYQVGMSGICGVFVFFFKWGEIQVSQDIQSMVDRYQHGISALCNIFSVKCHLLDRGTCLITTPVDPYQNRLFRTLLQLIRPDIQALAMLIL